MESTTLKYKKMETTQILGLVTMKSDGRPVTTSLMVAERFGKRHDRVLRSIENLECSNEFRVSNFGETSYTQAQNGQSYKMYEITKDGFAFLVLGFTGKPAAELKEAFINEFNRLLKTQQPVKQLSKEEQILHVMQFLQADVKALQEQNQIHKETIQIQQHEIKKLAPKAEYAETVLHSNEAILTTIIAKELGMGAITLNQVLHGLGIIHKIDGKWVAYAKYQDKGYTVTRTSTYVNRAGEACTSQLTCWNERGRKFIHELIDNYRKSNDITAKKN